MMKQEFIQNKENKRELARAVAMAIGRRSDQIIIDALGVGAVFVPFVTKDEVTNGFLQLEDRMDNKFNELERKIDNIGLKLWFVIIVGTGMWSLTGAGVWWLITHVALK